MLHQLNMYIPIQPQKHQPVMTLQVQASQLTPQLGIIEVQITPGELVKYLAVKN